MNEQIRKFEKQCWDHQSNHLDTVKFAELIVTECLETIHRGIDNFGSANEDTLLGGRIALFYSYRNIQRRFGMGDYKDKQHFGVGDEPSVCCFL